MTKTVDIQQHWEALADTSEPIGADNAPIGFNPFPIDALPGIVRQFVTEWARAIGCDASFVFLPLLGCLARAIGSKRTIRLKKTWVEVPIFWAVLVAKSGGFKSPAILAATAALQQKQADVFTQYAEAMKKFEYDVIEYERAYAVWKRSKSDELPPWQPVRPVLERFIVGDCTIAALADILASQTDGVLVVRDELAGLIDSLGPRNAGRGGDTGHWLATWNAAPMTFDRKTGAKKMIHIPRAAVNIIGGIQPGVFRRALGREHLVDGLCSRLLITMPPAGPARWSEATVDAATEQQLAELLYRLLAMAPAADAEGKPMPYPLPLSPQAKEEWVTFFNRHRDEQANLDDNLASAWSKLLSYAARLALVVQLCRWSEGVADDSAVDTASVRSAIQLIEFFKNEARRAYTWARQTSLASGRHRQGETRSSRVYLVTFRPDPFRKSSCGTDHPSVPKY